MTPFAFSLCSLILASLVPSLPSPPPAAPPASGQWRVEAEPLVRIGTTGTRRGHDLLGVVGAVRLEDGTIAVASSGTAELRFNGPDGAWLRDAGGEGHGPGEFSRLEAVFAYPGDSVATWDGRQGRLTLFDRSGRVGRTIPVDVPHLSLRGVTANGEFVMQRPDAIGIAAEPGLGDVGVEILLVGADGEVVESLGRMLDHRVWIGRVTGLMATTDQPLGPRSAAAAGGARVFLADAAAARVTVRGTAGGDVGTIPAAVTTGAVTPGHLRAAKHAFAATLDEYPLQIREGLLAQFDAIPAPDMLPPFGEVVADADGHVWLQSGDPDRRREWHVSDAGGRDLATVTMPPVDRVLEIGRDYVLATWSDELDVEYVGVFRLHRG